MGKNGFSNVYNVSGPHSYQQITVDTLFCDKFFHFGKAWEVVNICSGLLKFFGKKSRGHSKCIRFSCSINIHENDMIRKRKCFCKLMKECFRSCVSMRLENTPRFSVRIMFHRSKCCLDPDNQDVGLEAATH